MSVSHKKFFLDRQVDFYNFLFPFLMLGIYVYIAIVTIMLVICFLKLREEVLLKSNALKGEKFASKSFSISWCLQNFAKVYLRNQMIICYRESSLPGVTKVSL